MHRALVLSSISEPPVVKTIPTPQPGPGSAVVRVLVANVVAYSREIIDGTRQHPLPTPLVIGNSAIARVAAVGPDATSLAPGQLVLVDTYIRGRDDPSATSLFGLHAGFTEAGQKLAHGEWRDSTYAEYAKVPLENLAALDENRLLGPVQDGGLGYTLESLAYIAMMLVPFGGLSDIAPKPGETVVIAPATGSFGGAAVPVALAMGAKVIAMGRNPDVLKKLTAISERVHVVAITGDAQADADALRRLGPIDGVFDISSPLAGKSTHLKSGILAVRPEGRVSLMGGVAEDVLIPYMAVTAKSLQLKGKMMYDRDAARALIRLVESGVLKLGDSIGATVAGTFALDDWDAAFTAAEKHCSMGVSVLIAP